MAFEPENKYVLINHEVLPIAETEIPDNEKGIYEVVRVIDGIPLFFEDHYKRFHTSAEIAGIKLDFVEEEIFTLLLKLISKSEVIAGNIIITKDKNLVAHFIRHNYPTDEMYRQGADCKLLFAERPNPNAKVLHTEAREKANKMLAETGCYEVLLVDHNGNVTEGSRSNVFFAAGDKVYTAPGSHVLLGITRQKAVEVAKSLKIQVVEKEIHFTELQQFDAAFITGTSPKILPVRQIDSVNFDIPNKEVARIMRRYDIMIDEYIGKHK
jgi:branched-chain amino acid aminotransferase